MDDLRHAIRTLRRSPTFTLVTIAILTLGIGANTAIFTVVNAVMLRSLPVRAPSELVHLLSVYPGEPRQPGFPWLAYEHYRDNSRAFSELIAVAPAAFQTAFDAGEAVTIQGQYVSGNFFPALGVRPVLGRMIGPEDDVVGSQRAAIAVASWAPRRVTSSASCWGARWAWFYRGCCWELRSRSGAAGSRPASSRTCRSR